MRFWGSRKLVGLVEVIHTACAMRRRGRDRRITWTNGVFDLCHLGHLQLLDHARFLARGGLVIVGVDSDERARHLKGPGRPIHDAQTRASVIAGLAVVDYVIVFGTATEDESEVVRAIRPDVLVKSEEYRGTPIPGAEYAGEVVYVPRTAGVSTTKTLDAVAECG